jgi:tetratricopeptide (TPR) repeat protein
LSNFPWHRGIDLSLYHNNFLVKNKKTDAATLNNLGVAQSGAGLKSKAIKSYQKAIELNETLAMKNLASSLAEDGYLSESNVLIEKAIQIKNYDKRIHSVYAQIEEKEKSETISENKILEKSKKRKDFYCEYATAYLNENSSNLNGEWENNTLRVTISTDQNTFKGIGEHKKITGGMLASLLNSGNENQRIEFEGTITGMTAQFKKTIHSERESKTLLDLPQAINGLMIIDSIHDTISICEITSNISCKYYSLKRKT